MPVLAAYASPDTVPPVVNEFVNENIAANAATAANTRPSSAASKAASVVPPSSQPAAVSPQKPTIKSADTMQTPATTEPVTPETYTINEQFTGSTLNPNLWEAMSLPKAYRNNEQQDYTPAQIKVADNHLQINAVRDSTGNWHSGEVHSKWHYKYGEFEVRMAMNTTGTGAWPAAWLLSSTSQWPGGGEIDIIESINGAATAYGTVHGGGQNGVWQLQQYNPHISTTDFHTYKIIKKPQTISWWIDGVKRAEWTPKNIPTGAVWPFESNNYFAIMNLAVGGTWPGASDASTPGNMTLLVDYFTVKNGT